MNPPINAERRPWVDDPSWREFAFEFGRTEWPQFASSCIQVVEFVSEHDREDHFQTAILLGASIAFKVDAGKDKPRDEDSGFKAS